VGWQTPIYLPARSRVEVQFWRCTSSSKASLVAFVPTVFRVVLPWLAHREAVCVRARVQVWYEWAVTAPQQLAVHNPGGRSSHIGLFT
jgi:hypothetical protein